MIEDLKRFLDEVKWLRGEIRGAQSKTIGQKGLRRSAESLGSKWCNELSPALRQLGGFAPKLLATYDAAFSKLIALSSPNNLQTSYLRILDAIAKTYRNDLILPLQQGRVAVVSELSSFDSFIAQLEKGDEGDYFKEALSCAKSGYLRAATVMGWCAAIDRIHRKITLEGFSKFNVASAHMSSQTAGRFKRFNQTHNVGSLSELREVFDTTVLWILEGMGWIDSNQHTRLRSCFEMRNHSAHPGEAPVTEYNLLSFFSDIDQIVFRNTRFALTSGAPPQAGG